MSEVDATNPSYYRSEGNVQVIELIRYMPFSIGNAIKYVYRNERKALPREDLTKALWYLEDYSEHPAALDEPISAALVAKVVHGCQTWETRAVIALVDVYSSVQLSWGTARREAAVEKARKLIEERMLEAKSTVSEG